jgi:hypothetical protein
MGSGVEMTPGTGLVVNGKPNESPQKAGSRALILPFKPARKRNRASAPLREALRMGMEGQVRNAATYSDGLERQRFR